LVIMMAIAQNFSFKLSNAKLGYVAHISQL
jgi:hypothetical protein